jgi:hypothetical protein
LCCPTHELLAFICANQINAAPHDRTQGLLAAQVKDARPKPGYILTNGVGTVTASAEHKPNDSTGTIYHIVDAVLLREVKEACNRTITSGGGCSRVVNANKSVIS